MNTSYPTPITPSQTRIGWIGTGVMGAAMASRLLSAGYTLTIYARTPSKTLSLQSQGAHLVNSPSEVAKSSDVIFTMLGHPPDVRQIVLENPDSILSSINPGSVIIDHTSSHPDLAKQIFTAAREKNCWSVDAPVSGGDIGARDGKLAILAGGDEGVVKWLIPLFNLMGKPNYMGVAGCGQSCKIANQITVGGNLLGLSEGLVFAEAAGLDKSRWLEAVRGGAAGSMVMDLFGERMIERDFRPGGFAEYMVKDLGMGLDVVEQGGDGVAVLPGAALCKQMFSGMVANGDGQCTVGLVAPNNSEETVGVVKKGDVLALPKGVVSWWFNTNTTILFLAETTKAEVPGEIAYFFMTGILGVLTGFQSDFVQKIFHLDNKEAEDIVSSQPGSVKE